MLPQGGGGTARGFRIPLEKGQELTGFKCHGLRIEYRD